MTSKKKKYNKRTQLLDQPAPTLNKNAVADTVNEICELRQPIWAVVNGSDVFANDLTYDQAVGRIGDYREATIITTSAAARI